MKKLKALKKQVDHFKSQLAGTFHRFARDCTHGETVYHDKDPWFKCKHKSYHLAEYTDITPCDVDKCPLLN